MKVSLSIVFIFLSCFSQAQLNIGYFHDLDKLPIHGTINTREYSPENLLVLIHRSDAFEKGTVYYSDGNIEEGLIKYENKKIWYKPTKAAEKDKLKPEEVLALTIGVDSFFVANHFNVEQLAVTRPITEPQFMQYLTAFNGLTFAKHYHFSSGMAQSYTMASAVIETYQVSEDEGKTWTSFPKRGKMFEEVALKYFSHIPYLKRKIEEGSLDHEDMMTLIKSAEYYDTFKNGRYIYFDRYWNQIYSAKESAYSAEIKSLRDSIWTISYASNEAILYEASYHSLFPHKRHGTIKSMSTEGYAVLETSYFEDEKKSESINYENGNTHYVIDLVDFYMNYNTYTIPKYNQVLDSSGNSLVQIGDWNEELKTSNGIVTNEFYGDGLSKAYRVEDGQKIYHITDFEYNFKLKKLQTSLSRYFESKDFLQASEDNAQGMYFIHVQISDKGRAVNNKILNSIHPTLDSKVKGWANSVLKESSYYPHKFKPYKVEKEKVDAEFLVPLQFSIVKFYRQSANANYNWQFQQQMMFHQQMMMQPMNLPTPPPMPMGF